MKLGPGAIRLVMVAATEVTVAVFVGDALRVGVLVAFAPELEIVVESKIAPLSLIASS